MSDVLWTMESVCLGPASRRLDGLTGVIRAGTTVILGESGAGKSSLLSLLAGLERPDRGRLRRCFSACSGRVPVYWAPQGGGLWPHLTVLQHLLAVGKDENSADKLLAQFGLTGRRAARPAELSQGERARLSLARALAVPAQVLLFDEPLNHVDSPRRASGWTVIREFLRETGTHLVLATHEPPVALRLADDLLCLENGRIIWQGDVRVLYRDPPDERRGRLLGPLNWLTPDDCAVWELEYGRSNAVRPEQLAVVPVGRDEAVGTAEDSAFVGGLAETVIRHGATGQERLFVHGAQTAMLPGTPVRLKRTETAGRMDV